jgi:hypothetical protein
LQHGGRRPRLRLDDTNLDGVLAPADVQCQGLQTGLAGQGKGSRSAFGEERWRHCSFLGPKRINVKKLSMNGGQADSLRHLT